MKNSDDFFQSNSKNENHNLLFYPDHELKKIKENSFDSIGVQCIAELFRRWFITKSQNTADLIDSMLPDDERNELSKRLDSPFLELPSREKLTDTLWSNDSAFSKKCQAAVRKTLIQLCHETDGFIPVFIKKEAFFIPFHFESGPHEVRDLTGAIVPEWTMLAPEIFDEDFAYSCVIHCAQDTLGLSFSGKSLMLPLLLASWRKKGLINYNILHLLSTGTIENNALKAVDTSTKADALKRSFPEAKFFFPESTTYCASENNEIVLAVGMTKQQLLEKMPALIELHGLKSPNLRDALCRLPQLLEERERVSDKWHELLTIVRHHGQTICSLTNHKEYILYLMLESSICCHLGKTQEALTLNKKAQKFAANNAELEKYLRRLEIEELVELQDYEMFDELFPLAETLHGKIEKLEDPDLQMRYFGTMGQAFAYGTLAGKRGCSSKLAKECFEKTLKFAYQLGNPGDIAQDLNYLYLWHAIFEPDTTETTEIYDEVKKYIDYNLIDKQRDKNLFFLKRYKALGLYRKLLMTGITADCEEIEQCIVGNHWWLPATINKYCGALYAACGELNKAKKCFDEAARLVSEGDPIIDMIRLTVLAEAYRSLKNEEYKKQAIELAFALQDKVPSTSDWLAYLEDKGDFPGLTYWY